MCVCIIHLLVSYRCIFDETAVLERHHENVDCLNKYGYSRVVALKEKNSHLTGVNVFESVSYLITIDYCL